jgi:hypothetical protein
MDDYTFDLQYLFDCYPIRKRLLKHLRIHDLYVLEFVVRGVDHQHIIDVMEKSYLTNRWAQRGYLNVLKWAYNNGCRPTCITYQGAAESGRIDILEWLLSVGVKPGSCAYASAALCGHIRVMRWLRNPRKGNVTRHLDGWSLENAIIGGHTDLAEWLLEQVDGKDSCNSAIYTAMKHGEEGIYQKLVEKCKHEDQIEYRLQGAARVGNLKLVQALYSRAGVLKSPSGVARRAIKSKNLKLVKWLCCKRKFCKDVFTAAVKVGDLRILEYLKEKCEVDKYAHVEAAFAGHDHVTKWLIENGYSLSEEVFEEAVSYRKNSLYAMKYLRRWNCPWNMNAYGCAIEEGVHYKILWLAKHGCPFDREQFDGYIPEKTLRLLEKLGY